MRINLCKKCKEELNDYNPYVNEEGNMIPISELEINIVSEKKCDNYTLNGKFVNLKGEYFKNGKKNKQTKMA